MSEVIGAEGEEVCNLSDIIGDQGRARYLNHGPYEIVHADALFRKYFFGGPVNDLLLMFHLFRTTDQRDHHFWEDFNALLGHGHGGLKDGARLHFRDLRIGDAEAAPAMSQHGIEFMQLFY